MAYTSFHDSRKSLKHSAALELRRLRFGRPKERVFCIGFQKTGTTSVQYALSLLGYRVAGIFSMRDLGNFEDVRVRALELMKGFDAAGDIPWPVLFRDLDAAFPRSKFILTTREPDLWYASACKHFGEKRIRLHKWIYGAASPVGNEATYKNRLVSHEAEVREYFCHRPKDLIEFDVARGDGWEKLCKFLDKPIPKGDFPRLNAAKAR